MFKSKVNIAKSVCFLLFIYFTGLSERVADIKTRAQAMKCLTTFSEAVGPGFIFERVSTK